jgi:hypothetical protein
MVIITDTNISWSSDNIIIIFSSIAVIITSINIG